MDIFQEKHGRNLSRDNKTTMIVIVSIGTVIFKTAFLILSKIIYDYDIELIVYIFYTIKEVIYNVIITFVIFKPITMLADIINKSKDTYYLL